MPQFIEAAVKRGALETLERVGKVLPEWDIEAHGYVELEVMALYARVFAHLAMLWIHSGLPSRCARRIARPH